VWEVAGDEGLAHELAIAGIGEEELEASGEAGEDFADVRNADFTADGRGAIGLKSLPESIARQKTEWEIGVVLVVVLADEEESSGEAVADFLAPWDALGTCKAFVNEIESGEQQQRLVWLLVWRAFFKGRDADVEVVETFDCGGEKHRR